jgi:hypothetical protein
MKAMQAVRRPFLAWTSLAMAGTATVAAAGSILVTFLAIRQAAETSGQEIGAKTGGGSIGFTVLVVGVAMVVGVTSGIVGMARGERPRGLHELGIILKVVLPMAGLALAQLVIG